MAFRANFGGMRARINKYKAPPTGSGGGGLAEPSYRAGIDTLIKQDSFDRATGTITSGWTTNGAPFTAVAGRSGNAIRCAFTTAEPDYILELGFAETMEFYASYWFNIQSGWLPYSGVTGSGLKWFMLWRPTQQRYTNGVSTLTGGPVGYTNSGWEFTTHDNQSGDEPNPFCQNINKTIRFNTVNDGQWHRYTLYARSGTSGGGDRIWIDGTLVLDSFDGALGVPAGGYSHGSEGINLIQLPGLVVDGVPDSSWNGTLDIDDLTFWKP